MQSVQQQQAPQKLSPLKNNSLLKSFLKSSNPSQVIQNMVASNPKMQTVMSLLNSSGLTPKQFFYQYAQQNGVDPDEFLNSLN